jgi:cyclopropane fatty-acyl-phospholipid synthase-like methyltransferase
MSHDAISRARASKGTSAEAIYRMAAHVISKRAPGGSTLLDVGCGTGELHGYVKDSVSEYIGLDVVRHDGLPTSVRFVKIDLDSGCAPLPDAFAEIVAAIETIEHLEIPERFSANSYGWLNPADSSWLQHQTNSVSSASLLS